MKSIGLCCGAALLAGCVLVSQGVSEDNLTFFAADDLGTSQDTVVAAPDTVTVDPDDNLESLRKQYLEAAQQRAGLMDQVALQQALNAEKKAVAELRAKQQLQLVEQQLQQITNEYPQTAAGKKAKGLLMQLQAGQGGFDEIDMFPRETGDNFRRSSSAFDGDF